jgi:hypothetical protein
MRLPARRLEIVVGPPGGKGKMWTWPTHAIADIHKTSGSDPNKCTLVMHNLSDESLEWIERPGHILIVQAGADNPQRLFMGNITVRQVKSGWTGVDRVTEIDAGDGRVIYRDTMVSLSYTSGTTRDVVIAKIISEMDVPKGHIAKLKTVTYSAGYAFTGRARLALDDVLQDDAQWSIQNGVINITARGESLPGQVVLVSPTTGLVGSPTRTDKGADCEMILEPKISPGVVYQLESDSIKGLFRATDVVHSVSTDGSRWATSITGVPI